MLFPSFHESEIDMASVLLLLLLSRLSIDLNWGAAFPSSLPLSFTVLNSIIFIHLREKEGREGKGKQHFPLSSKGEKDKVVVLQKEERKALVGI